MPLTDTLYDTYRNACEEIKFKLKLKHADVREDYARKLRLAEQEKEKEKAK